MEKETRVIGEIEWFIHGDTIDNYSLNIITPDIWASVAFNNNVLIAGMRIPVDGIYKSVLHYRQAYSEPLSILATKECLDKYKKYHHSILATVEWVMWQVANGTIKRCND